MRTLKFLLQKEFRQIFRNPNILKVIIAIPIVQLIILPLAADYEIKNIQIAITDHDHSQLSDKLINSVISSGYFKLTGYNQSFPESFSLIEKDKADLVLEIPEDFERNLTRENKTDLLIAVNAINGTKALVGGSYLSGIINRFNANIRLESGSAERFQALPQLEVVTMNWFNPFMNYKLFMVPGILVLLITMIGSYLCALNIVKEKEVGTIEQINVTPVKKIQFILGKLIPFWIIGMFIFTLGLYGIARILYGIRPLGSPLVLYSFLAVYLIALLGIGLLISTYASTQQQAMSLAFFFIMIFILMSGLFTSIDSMPGWARVIGWINPVTYFIDVVRMVVLKGSGFRETAMHFGVITFYAFFFNAWAILNYRKTS